MQSSETPFMCTLKTKFVKNQTHDKLGCEMYSPQLVVLCEFHWYKFPSQSISCTDPV